MCPGATQGQPRGQPQKSEGNSKAIQAKKKICDVRTYGRTTVCWHEDLGKFPNCLKSIPSENLGLKKENEQIFLANMHGQKNYIAG